MSVTELETARQRLALYLEAEAAILSGAQESTVGSRRWRKADLSEIREAIQDLESKVSDLEARASGSSRLHTGVPR